MKKIAIYGGTSEGRVLSNILSGHMDVTLMVATDYGKAMCEQKDNLKIISHKMNRDEMIDFIKENSFEYIIDATHPYAQIVTENIIEASAKTNVKYLRVIRKQSKSDDVIWADSMDKVIEILNETSENIFVTTGSKDLEHYTKIKDYSKRVFVRIIPMISSLEKTISLGFKRENIICMQGPFSHEMNEIMLKNSNAKFLITKDSGEEGGFSDKVSASKKVGAKTIVLSRKTEEPGYTPKEILEYFNITNEHNETENKKFPLFVDIKNRGIIVFGGGSIAERRVHVLLNFGEKIKLVAPDISDNLRELDELKKIVYIKSKYEESHIDNPFMVIAATNNREVNKHIGKICRERNIFVSVCDNKEECTFWFPAIIDCDGFIGGVVSPSGDHKAVKEISEKIRSLINDEEKSQSRFQRKQTCSHTS